MRKVYLAGPITGLEYDEAKDWRDDYARRLARYGFEGLSPMRDKDEFRVKGKLSAFFDDGYEAVERDLCDIEESECVIVNLLGAEEISLGSMAELGYAFASEKPIILVMEGEGNPHHHVFPYYMANVLVPSLDDALRALLVLSSETHAAKVPYAPRLPAIMEVYS